MKKTRIIGITAIRSEYFLQRPIFEALMRRSDLEFSLIVTGAHLSPLYNYTVREIEQDGFPILERIESLLYSDRDAGRLKGAANQLQVLGHVLDKARPDWLLAPADREEALNLAICGAYLGIATAHYGAGDRVVGNVDDMVRHAVSRIAHLLLTTNEDARVRLLRSGEEEWRVHNVGHSGLDRIRSTRHMSAGEIARALGVEEIRRPYVIVIQHPLSSEAEDAGKQMEQTLEAVVELGLQAFISYPNSDAGSGQIIDVISRFRSHRNLKVFSNIPDEPFVNLLRGASMLIGNSSLGLLEAPFLKLPAINVGNRQSARHHSANVFFVPHDKEAIVTKAKEILHNPDLQARIANCENPFGSGQTGEQIAEIIATTPIDSKLMNKDLSF
jgi:GDP/UDP-N,N'-diacetylbacillosamine 2-epimerase (hydrolysing)